MVIKVISLFLLIATVFGEDNAGRELTLGLDGNVSPQILTLSLIHTVVWGVPILLLILLILPAFGLNMMTIFNKTKGYDNGYNYKNNGYDSNTQSYYKEDTPTVLESILSGIQNSYQKFAG